MAGEFTKFIWQHKYSSNRWKNYSYDEHCILNKAVQKHQKTVTLPSSDPKKKINVNLEKMFQKNLVSDFEQNVRCIVFNSVAVTWSWKDDCNQWISFTPRIAFYLELAKAKNVESVDIFCKADYEINLRQFTQVNKETQFIRSICREIVEITDTRDSDSFMKLLDFCCASEKLIKKMCEENLSSIHNVIFDLPTTTAITSTSPLQASHHENIVRALNEEVRSSSAVISKKSKVEYIPVDPVCPEADNYHIYCEMDDIYKVTLNFASLQANNNKFFIIELLKFHKKTLYAVWFHWGRTGYKGQHKLINCGSNLAEAKSTFEKKFYDKTHNHWSERHNFDRNPSKYDLVHTDFNNEVSSITISTAESKLDNKIQSLLQIICDKKSLEEAAREMSYDSSATPLGKITAKQILDGYKALDTISKIIQTKGKGKALVEACNNFYTKIPHDFKRKTPPILQSMDDVKEKLKMLEALSNIVLAMDVLNTSDSSENPIDKYYRSLDCNLIPLGHTSDEFNALKKCLLGTHGPTHNTYTMELIDAFLCVKDQQESAFMNCKNIKLLWHGSRMSNWIGILKKGLQIAPPEAPSTGYMFGKGIYFADVSSKSANYCFATKKKNEGLLLLSEVALGNPLSVNHAEDLSSLPSGYNSAFGIGKIQPASFETTVLSPEASVPCGPLEETESDEEFSLFYNEYIVYKTSQVKIKYILRIKFNFSV